jgi:hypothetical protein
LFRILLLTVLLLFTPLSAIHLGILLVPRYHRAAFLKQSNENRVAGRQTTPCRQDAFKALKQ